MNDIRHITSAPYHPASNGLSERAVQIVKQGLRKQTEGEIQTRVDRFLFSYRNTPHPTTGCTPAELLLRCKPRSWLNLLHPKRKHHVEVKQEQQQQYRNVHKRQRLFADVQDVYISQHERGTPWLSAFVTKQSGQIVNKELFDGRHARHHLDHVFPHGDFTNVSPATSRDEQPCLSADSPLVETAKPAAEPKFILRRSSRQTKPIVHLDICTHITYSSLHYSVICISQSKSRTVVILYLMYDPCILMITEWSQWRDFCLVQFCHVK